MKSKIIWNDVDAEAARTAEQLGLPMPKPELNKGEIYFDASYIHVAYLNSKKEIVVYFPSGHWLLEYNEDLWEEIKTHLNKNIGCK